MIVDTSALMAVLVDEPEADALIVVMSGAELLGMSAANYLECAIVVDRREAPTIRRRFDQIVRALGIEIVPVSVEQIGIAREAHRDYGRGSGHPARLNFGDCFAYALAAARDEPLLFKGDDFSHTDVAPVAY